MCTRVSVTTSAIELDGTLRLVASTWINVLSTATSSPIVILPGLEAIVGFTAETKTTVDAPMADGGAVFDSDREHVHCHLQRHALSQPPQRNNMCDTHFCQIQGHRTDSA